MSSILDLRRVTVGVGIWLWCRCWGSRVLLAGLGEHSEDPGLEYGDLQCSSFCWVGCMIQGLTRYERRGRNEGIMDI